MDKEKGTQFLVRNKSAYYDAVISITEENKVSSNNYLLKRAAGRGKNEEEHVEALAHENIGLNILPSKEKNIYEVYIPPKVYESYTINLNLTEKDHNGAPLAISLSFDKGRMLVKLPERGINEDISFIPRNSAVEIIDPPNNPDETVTVGEDETVGDT